MILKKKHVIPVSKTIQLSFSVMISTTSNPMINECEEDRLESHSAQVEEDIIYSQIKIYPPQ